MNANPFTVSKIAIYCESGYVEKLHGDWLIAELSSQYPISSTTGIDSLLYNVPEEEREMATIEFYDSHNRAISDPRIFMEDLD